MAYAQFEQQNDELKRLEVVFQRSLVQNPYVPLWSMYLDYIRRVHNLTTDESGTARKIVSTSFDFVLQSIGMDKDSGNIWKDYVDFVKSGPGNVAGSSWQDQQKMDSVRKAYTRAVSVPTQYLTQLWKEYDQFELGLNKVTVSFADIFHWNVSFINWERAANCCNKNRLST